MSTASIETLKKHTVPQLKALCKDKGITGYSKLGKDAIIQKLLDFERQQDSTRIQTRSSQIDVNQGERLGAIEQIPQRLRRDSEVQGTDSKTRRSLSTIPRPSESAPTEASGLRIGISKGLLSSYNHPLEKITDQKLLATTTAAQPFLKDPNISLVPVPDFIPSERVCSEKHKLHAPLLPPQKKLKVADSDAGFHLMVQNQPFSSTISALSSVRKSNPHHLGNDRAVDAQSETNVPLHSRPDSNTVTLEVITRKRFKPLVSNSAKKFSPTGTILVTGTTSRDKILSKATPHHEVQDQDLQLHLDFAANHPVKLWPISLPPLISQRKRVDKLSLLLSLLAPGLLHSLSKISRLFRFAAYASAMHRLQRSFPGKRLEEVLKQNPPRITNLWPYLRQREKERKYRRDMYDNSFLNRIPRKGISISNYLWTSPDHEKQITVAIRFLMTFLYSCVSSGTNGIPELSKNRRIVGVEEVIPGEIWMAKLQSSCSTDLYYVLESTCEAVGLPSIPTDSHKTASNPGRKDGHVRADWSVYIALRLRGESVRRLVDHLQWPNHEEYDHGLSKVWLTRIKGEGSMGKLKRLVAERYTMACIVDNSLSGRMLSSTEMAQEFNGTPVDPLPRRNGKNLNIHLFLPAHHHVESVHFTTRKGQTLHPALAIIQTPGREYFILKDNGMQVGCEEDGVCPLWMNLLDCDANGVDMLVSR